MAELIKIYADLLWIAADLNDNVAVFTSAGRGAIPKAIIDQEILSLDDLEESVNQLPIICEHIRIDRYKSYWDIDSYSTKGLYGYDWTSLESYGTRRYNLVGIPSNPLKVDQIPSPLQVLLAGMPRMKLHFSESPSINPPDVIDCYVPERD